MEVIPLDLPQTSALSGPLRGSKDPRFEIVSEKPWHHAAALMFAAGAVTQKEVAEAFDVTAPTLQNLLRQPWFQQKVTAIMAEHGGRDVMSLFRGEAFNSLITLTELRDDANAPKAVRRSCAVDILDRALGKPLQRIETSGEPTSSDPVGEVRRLEEENARHRSNLFAASVAARAEDSPETRA